MSTYFITGTDTGVGKTHASCALLRRARHQGLRACGYKPVASGCERTPDGLRNEDGLALLAESAPGLSYAQVNPLALEPAIAPHVAAREAGIVLDPAAMSAGHDALAAAHELVLVEGAGGWRVPLNDTLGFDDWVAAQGWPVVLVVAMRLGCINHALLSAESILRRTRLAGWIANRVPPEMPRWRESLDTLVTQIPAPLLGVLPTGLDPDAAAAALTLPG
ncbi:dethiobiotin synthase [Sinimarinibacterium flocculans]|uniref:ATP-dependent dethiobiotin synthetase BioD n=1 Tax=Sinimarinibacterium flocculans TaxID=985250 RepID=A0A318EDU3_9GAMM|nr:dethiobiotin synthase [Sinimarinibacterium flocculans]PXV69804.1 dethiobiotin synthase [Sinimarinibacterium flocculans]